VFLVTIKFFNLDFGPYKKKSTQFAPVKFKLIGFSPSFNMWAKKNHYVTWVQWRGRCHVGFRWHVNNYFLVKRQKCPGTKIKIAIFFFSSSIAQEWKSYFLPKLQNEWMSTILVNKISKCAYYVHKYQITNIS
jgi:hypothetical protein